MTTALLLALALPASVLQAEAPASRPVLEDAARRTLDALIAGAPAAARAWPGYDFHRRPLLVQYASGSGLLVGFPGTPPGFRPLRYGPHPVAAADRGPELPRHFLFRMSFEGREVMAIRQARTPRHIDSPETVAWVAVHEDFHEYQKGREFTRGWRSYEVEDGTDIALAALENRALRTWLRSGDREAIRDFAALRETRRRLNPGSSAETGQENLEGTAMFVEAEAQEAHARGAGMAAIQLQLDRPVDLEAMGKSRLYGVGAALCVYLQHAMPGRWQSAVERGRRLSELALEAIALAPGEADRRVSRLALGPEFAGRAAAAQADVEGVRRKREELWARFEGQPGVRVELVGVPEGGHVSDGSWFFYGPLAILERVHEYAISQEGVRYRVAGRMLRYGRRRVEFASAAPALELDGLPAAPGVRRRFQRAVIRDADVEVDISRPGTAEHDGRSLRLTLD